MSLDKYLKRSFSGLKGVLSADRTTGGLSNPSYFLAYDNWSAVLRKQPDGLRLSKSAHRIDREFRVLQALHGSAVPVPEPILYCDDSEFLGTPFYLMERLHGRIFPGYSMPGLSVSDRRQCYRSMCETLAAIHAFDYEGAGLEDYGRPGNYFERQIAAWAVQWERLRSPDNPHIDPLLLWMRANLPLDDRAALNHGDFRVANIIFHPTEPKVIGVIDWELSTIGHPLADVAFNIQAWRLKPEQNGGVLDLDLEALGIPTEEQYLKHYSECLDGAPLPKPFHIAFAMFRASVGVAGVAARYKAEQPCQSRMVEEALRFSIAYALAGMAAAGISPVRPRG